MSTRRVTIDETDALGYYADIPQAFWRRVTRYHIPVKWFACWLSMVAMQFGFGFFHLTLPGLWILVGGSLLALGELGLLQWLTWADPQWDSLITQRDNAYYEAD